VKKMKGNKVTVVATPMPKGYWAIECSACGPLSVCASGTEDLELKTHIIGHATPVKVKK